MENVSPWKTNVVFVTLETKGEIKLGRRIVRH